MHFDCIRQTSGQTRQAGFDVTDHPFVRHPSRVVPRRACVYRRARSPPSWNIRYSTARLQARFSRKNALSASRAFSESEILMSPRWCRILTWRERKKKERRSRRKKFYTSATWFLNSNFCCYLCSRITNERETRIAKNTHIILIFLKISRELLDICIIIHNRSRVLRVFCH